MLLLLVSIITQTPMHCGTGIFERLKATAGDLSWSPATTRSPAVPPRLGETRQLWLQNMSVMPPQQYQTSVTCRGIGEHCYVMVEDSAWDAGQMDSSGVARIIERFDHSSPRDTFHGVWYHNTRVLGQPPDAIDQDSLIYLIYYDIGSFHGYVFDGFWQYFDEYYDSTSMRRWGYHSNEVECVYLDCYPSRPSEDYRIAIAAHEFGHMIHWNYDQAESLWVQEGCCELAMWLFGSPDPISGFPSSSDNDLTRWTGSWADYIKTYLWFLFLYEQYGGRVGNDLIHNIIRSPQTSIEGIDEGFDSTGLDERFETVFDQWVLANCVNDTAVLGGRYGYCGESLPSFAAAGYHTSYPVSRTGSLDRWAGEYLLFRRGRDLELEFDGADPADFHLYLACVDTLRHRARLDTVRLDSLQRGYVSLPGAETAYQSFFLIPANHTRSDRMGYEYRASAAGIADGGPGLLSSSRPGPTVVRGSATLGPGRDWQMYSSDGREIAGEPDGKLSPGVYFVRPGSDVAVARRLVVIR